MSNREDITLHADLIRDTRSNKFRLFLLRAIAFLIFFCCPVSVWSTGKVLIFPIPQQVKLTTDTFVVNGNTSILIPENAGNQDVELARFLVRELSDKYGVAVKTKTVASISEERNVILMGTLKNPLIRKYCKDHKLELTKKNPGKEGYILHVKSNLIVIAGWDDAGAFYGLQSLRQLLMVGSGKVVQGIQVTDWPNLPFRGIRIYVPGPENITFFKRFVQDFMALYKYNKVILEVISMRLDRHPEVNAGWIDFSKQIQYSRLNSTEGPNGELKDSSHSDAGDGCIIEKEEVKDMVAFANSNYLEVIPEIPSLTHGYYLLTRHPELAEYPNDKYPDTYCPSNPASYDLMFDVYDEYVEVMKPEMVQIGHDEWCVPLGICPRCNGKDYSELFAQDIGKIHTYFSDKGIRVAMWGDYLLESVRGKGPQKMKTSSGMSYQVPGAIRPEIVKTYIPKDILVFNWFWGDTGKEKELEQLGFKQVYGNLKPNISHWDERIKQVDAIGGAPSSWAATNEYNFGKDLISDFLGCANLLWSTHTIDQLELGEIVRWELISSVRSDFKGKRISSQDGDSVVPVDISSHFNLATNSSILNIGLSAVKSGNVCRNKLSFSLSDPKNARGNCVIAVASGDHVTNALPLTVDKISINDDVSSLIFLQACAISGDNKKAYFNIPDFFDTTDLLGWYEVVYEDGYKEIIPIQYGVNILEWNPGGEKSLDKGEGVTGESQNVYCYEADPVACSADMKNAPITFFAYEWVNKRYGKKIKEISLNGTSGFVRAGGYLKAAGGIMAPDNAIMLRALSVVKKRAN